jgi:hypothetical protein
LGYAEDVVGCKVYFPDERTAKFVTDLRVAEDVGYRDRHDVELDEDALSSLHFTKTVPEDVGGRTSVTTLDINSAMPSGLKEGEDDVDDVDETEIMETVDLNSQYDADEVEDEVEGVTEVVDSAEVDAGRARQAEEARVEEVESAGAQRHPASDEHEVPVASAEDGEVGDSVDMETEDRTVEEPVGGDDLDADVVTASDVAKEEDALSDAGTRGSSVAEEDLEGDDEVLEGDDEELSDEEITVASVFASDDDEERNSPNVLSLEEDLGNENEENNSSTPSAQHVMDHEVIDARALLGGNQPRQTGKRTQRDETPSEEERVENDAAKAEPKRTRRGLREASERRRPAYPDDYVVNAVQATSRVLDQNGKPIRGSNVRIPRNRREMLRSKWKEFFLMAEMEEMAALKEKGVIQEIPSEEVPEDPLPIKTMWVYAVKTDPQGYVIRFKARIVALGNFQRPGVDFRETFAPVARMSSLRLLLARAARLGLKVYGGDINTAYLNAWLRILQYLRSIDGYPCEINGNMYVVLKALYGLHQSGREWNSELNEWLREHGYQQSLTEPCLYYRFDGDTIMYVLVYVDDILVATNNEQCKVELFEELDKAYGIKDQGLLKEYLGIEVEQTATHIKVGQSKYAREILEKFGYSEAHAVCNPMEVNARLAPTGKDEEVNSEFPYREAVGMLMHLTTSTRPDLAFALSQLSRFVARPSAKHVGTLKRVLRYLAGTIDYGITYTRQQQTIGAVELQGFCDSDWAIDRANEEHYWIRLRAVGWSYRVDVETAIDHCAVDGRGRVRGRVRGDHGSAGDAEHLAGLPRNSIKLQLGIDSQAAYVMATNPTYSRRTRHIELRWHYVREQVEKGAITLHKVKGEDNPADTFTKALKKKRLKRLLQAIGVDAAD